MVDDFTILPWKPRELARHPWFGIRKPEDWEGVWGCFMFGPPAARSSGEPALRIGCPLLNTPQGCPYNLRKSSPRGRSGRCSPTSFVSSPVLGAANRTTDCAHPYPWGTSTFCQGFSERRPLQCAATEHAESQSARRNFQGILAPDAADRRRRRHRSPAGQGDAGRRGRRPDRRGRYVPARRGRGLAPAAHQEGPRGARRHAAFVRPRHGPGGDAAVRRRAAGLRADGRQRLLLRLRSWSSRSREDDFPKIEAEMAKIVKEDEPFERVEEPRDKAVQLCRDLGQTLKVEHIEEGLADEADGVVLSPGRVHRSVPRARTCPARGDRRVQAPLGGRRLLEGRRLAAAVAAALRHRLVRQAGARRLPQAGRRGQAPRSPRARQAARAVHRSIPTVGSGLVLWLPKGAIIRRELENFHLRRADQARLPAGLHAGHRPRATCTRSRAIIRTTPTASFRRSRWPTASGTCCSR